MIRSTPPVGPYDKNAVTRELRPAHGFDKDTLNTIRSLRKGGLSAEEIAGRINADLERVKIALAPLRTQRSNPDRKTINVGVEAHDALQAEQRQGEAMWRTIDRLLTELRSLRRQVDTVQSTITSFDQPAAPH